MALSGQRDAGNLATAITYAEKAVELVPNDRELAALLQTLRAQANKTDSR